jgi:hypothetical protein
MMSLEGVEATAPGRERLIAATYLPVGARRAPKSVAIPKRS